LPAEGVCGVSISAVFSYMTALENHPGGRCTSFEGNSFSFWEDPAKLLNKLNDRAGACWIR